MNEDLENLTILELRAFLRQETRKFLALLEQNGAIAELEVQREKIRKISDLLIDKEKRAENGV